MSKQIAARLRELAEEIETKAIHGVALVMSGDQMVELGIEKHPAGSDMDHIDGLIVSLFNLHCTKYERYLQ